MSVPCLSPGVTFQIQNSSYVELVRNLVAHGDAREGKWRGNWRMEWVASTLTPPPKVVYPALLKLMRTPRLPAVDWTDAPTDLNGLVRLGERRNLVSARVPSRSARAILYLFPSHGSYYNCYFPCQYSSIPPLRKAHSCLWHTNWIYTMQTERSFRINGSESSDLMAVPAFIVSGRSSLQG